MKSYGVCLSKEVIFQGEEGTTHSKNRKKVFRQNEYKIKFKKPLQETSSDKFNKRQAEPLLWNFYLRSYLKDKRREANHTDTSGQGISSR